MHNQVTPRTLHCRDRSRGFSSKKKKRGGGGGPTTYSVSKSSPKGGGGGGGGGGTLDRLDLPLLCHLHNPAAGDPGARLPQVAVCEDQLQKRAVLSAPEKNLNLRRGEKLTVQLSVHELTKN